MKEPKKVCFQFQVDHRLCRAKNSRRDEKFRGKLINDQDKQANKRYRVRVSVI